MAAPGRPRPRWHDLLDEAEAQLPAHEARRIVEAASGFEGGEYLTGLETAAPARAEAWCRERIARRAAGEPLQYVLGRWGFRSLDLMVDRRVLIPRPETEMVVEFALGELPRLATDPVVVDLGTGSGAIALSIATEAPRSQVWATDRSPEALAVAGANLAGTGTLAARRVRLAEGEWFSALPEQLRGGVDLVVSNPPYVADGEELPAEVAEWEPAGALRAGPTGLEAVEHITGAASGWLRRPGTLVLEIAPHQAAQATALAQAAGAAGVEVRPDLAGRPRALVARW